ncbi:HYR domain-containing protein [Aureisphaera galaxeae]|uniref:HYR domain-containing protein n=1 Tax=Aureisphaera galaxeae TaxID=1538023 RepID=UPI002350E7C3|nr:HYR domain-containing protein [Aureisphaera galaxeae]MDC8004566.1 HYR domain-containing protein [Aureisphaera galaxeae]
MRLILTPRLALLWCLLISAFTYGQQRENATALSIPEVETRDSEEFATQNYETPAFVKPMAKLPSQQDVRRAEQRSAMHVKDLKQNVTSVLDFQNEEILHLSMSSAGNIALLKKDGSVLEGISNRTSNQTIQIVGNDLDNTLIVDEKVLDLGIHILYEGRGQQTTTGDVLEVTRNSGKYQDVIITHFNKSDGVIQIDGKSSITFTGLEPITISSIVNLTINLTNIPNPDCQLANEATAGFNIFSGSTFEDVTFENPTGLVTISGGTDVDALSVIGLDAAFDADLTINFDSDDTIDFETNPTDLGSGDCIVTSGILFITEDLTTTGDINLTSEENFEINSAALLQSTDGDITINAGATPDAGDDYIGVRVNSGIIETTGTGNISITGQGAYNSNTLRHGIEIRSAGIVRTAGTGSITLNGTGADGTDSNSGLFIFQNNSLIESNGGGINITGVGGNGTANTNAGITLADDATVRDLNGGSIVCNGTGNGTATNNHGVLIRTNHQLSTSTGDITITGVGASTGINNNRGISMQSDADIVSTGGNITLNGTGGTTTGNGNRGIYFLSTGTTISTTGAGTISLLGTGGGGGNSNMGIELANGSSITAEDGMILIDGNGNGTGNTNDGVRINNTVSSTSGSINITGECLSTAGGQLLIGVRFDGSSNVQSVDGDITILGTGGDGTGNFNIGVAPLFGATISATGSGSISMTGTAGAGALATTGIFFQTDTTNISTNGGGISLTGTGGTGTGDQNNGMTILQGVDISDLGGGDITLIGNSGSGVSVNTGIVISNAPASTFTTSTGAISITGNGGTTTGSSNQGLVLTSGSLVTSTGNGNIQLAGTGGSGVDFNRGLEIPNATVTSNGGNITINGTGGAGTGNTNIGFSLRGGSQIATTASGNITISGLGGSGTANNYGSEVVGSSSISAVDGTIQIDGVSLDASDGNRYDGTSAVSTTNGNIILNGSTGVATASAIDINSGNASITAGGTITATTTTGEINTPNGIPAGASFNASNTIINGVLAPGQSPGQLIVNGNLTMGSGDTFEVEVDNFTTAGTEYDQVVVNGTVTITDATLTLIDNTSSTATPFEILTLINNDGTDAVTGTFTGLSNGSAVAFNGETWYIYYNQGDGNDVILRSSAINVEVDASGNLVYNDTVGVDDDLTIIIDGTNYRISDSTKPVIAGQGAVQDGNDALVAIASVTGAINVNTQDGDDNLAVDFGGGNYTDAINYDGGNQTTTPGDAMALQGGGSFASVTHTFVNSSDGSVDVTGNSTITYTGLEPVIDNLNVVDRIFTFTGGNETITMSDDGTASDNISFIDSTQGESVTFVNPTNSLTINSGTGNDTINVQGLDALYDADLIINGDDGTDTVNFITNATAIGNSDLNVNAELIDVEADLSTLTTGTLTLNASSRARVINGALMTSVDGNIAINGNVGGSQSGASNFDAVQVFQASAVRTTGTGNILFEGVGTSNGGGSTHLGVQISGASLVENTGTGSISLIGTGGNGINSNQGIRIGGVGTFVTTIDGGITMNGIGGDGSGSNNEGVLIFVGATVNATGTGAINVTGTAGTSFNNGKGVVFFRNDTSITSAGGGITIVGNGSGTNNTCRGVSIENGVTLTDTATGNISITGNGGNAVTNNHGIAILGGSSLNTLNGNVLLNGSGGNGTGNSNYGILANGSSTINVTGTGNVDITANGTGGVNTNRAYFGNNAVVTTNGGGITVNGTVTNTTGNNNQGIFLNGTSGFRDTNGGTITLIGTGDNAAASNHGVQLGGSNVFVETNNGQINITGVGGNGSGNGNQGVVFNAATVQDLGTGNINIDGTGGDGAAFNRGFEGLTATFASNGGNITLNGTGGNGSGNFNVGMSLRNACQVTTMGNGTISITGTGGVGNNANFGNETVGNATVTSENGAITITGIAPDTVGGGQDGLRIDGTFSSTQNAPITLNGGSGISTSWAVAFRTDVTLVQTGGDVTINATGSERIVTIASIPPNDLIDANAITVNGILRAGDNGRAQFPITGNTAFSAGDELQFNIAGFTNAGTDFDQISVTGTIDVTGSTLTLIDNFGPAEDNCETIVLIDNDGTDAIIGTFAGIAEGDSITFGGITGKVSYVGGDGNDFTLNLDDTAPNAVCQNITIQLDASGNASITAADVDGGSTDNCGIDTLAIDVSTFDCSNVGPNNVTLTVTDVNGNVATCIAVVTVEDSVAPNAVCMDIDVFLDAAGNATITPADVDGGSNDACGVASLSIDIDTFDCSNVGPNNVTLTVTDVNGNSSSCIAVVTVIDDIPPVISCPTDVVTGTDPGLCSAMVTFSDAIASDACGVTVAQTDGLPSGSDFPVGVNTVEFTATDANGNTTVCTFTITVNDDEAAVAVCQDITIQLDATGNATITASDVDGGSTDNCGIASLDVDIDTFDCSNVGDNTVTLTVTDDNGNVSTCTAIVTVEDVTAPEVFCQDITVQLDASGTVTILPSDIDNGSNDACGIDTYELDIDTFDCSNVGDNTVTLTVTDVNGNSASCTATVTVEDTIDPEVVCMDITVELDENGMAVITPEDVATISDNCGIFTTAIDIFEFDCDDIGAPITVQIFAEDVNGNLATCTAEVTVVDTMAPEITCPADQTVDPGPGMLFYEIPDYFATGEATAVDNCTDPVTITSQDPVAGTLVPDGVYTITLTAEDEYGNVSTCEFELTVESVLGLEDLPVNLSSIVVYPNPATDVVFISNPQNITLEKVTLFDLVGRKVASYDLRNSGMETSLDISNLATASYTLVIEGSGGQTSKRLIKE